MINTMRNNSKDPSRAVNESIVYEYFRLIKSKRINAVLDLFADDAIIYEPFSNINGGLKGKGSIKPFLEVAMTASDGLRHEIEFVKAHSTTKMKDNNKEEDQAIVLVTFERGEKIHARYTFKLTSVQEHDDYRDGGKKIQILHIEFIK
jgi:hypothetical protein